MLKPIDTTRALVAGLLVIVLNAQCQTSPEASFSFITDQDFFYTVDKTRNEDRNYTQGSSFTMSNSEYIHSWIFLPHRLLNLMHTKKGLHVRENVMSSVSVIGTAFTPRIIDSASPVVGDRPFAFLLGISTSQVNKIGTFPVHRAKFEAFTLNYALLGTNLGYSFQGFAHKYIVTGRPEDPKGWNTQLGRGGKITFLFNYEKVNMIFVGRVIPRKRSSFGSDIFMNFGGSVGYYERIFTGMHLRLGWIDPANISSWAFWGSSLASASRNTIPGAVSTQRRHCEFFSFSRVTVNMMGRNALLTGLRFGRSAGDYTLDRSWTNVAVLDLEFGLAFAHNWYKQVDMECRHRFIRLLYKNTIRSPEFNSRIFPARWHYFGSAGIQFSVN